MAEPGQTAENNHQHSVTNSTADGERVQGSVRITETPFREEDINLPVSPHSLAALELAVLDPSNHLLQGITTEEKATIRDDRKWLFRRLTWERANQQEIDFWTKMKRQIADEHPKRKLTKQQIRDIFFAKTDTWLHKPSSARVSTREEGKAGQEVELSLSQVNTLASLMRLKNNTVIQNGREEIQFVLSPEVLTACDKLQKEVIEKEGIKKDWHQEPIESRRQKAINAVKAVFESNSGIQIAQRLGENVKVVLEEIARQSERIPVDIFDFLPGKVDIHPTHDKRLDVVDVPKTFVVHNPARKMYSLHKGEATQRVDHSRSAA